MDSRLKEILDDFGQLGEWDEKYAQLISMGQALPPFPAEFKRDEYKVRGCIAQVWLVGTRVGDNIKLQADSDALIVKGLIALILEIYDNRPLNEIAMIEVRDFFELLGLTNHLSPNRRNGFFAMTERIKQLSTMFLEDTVVHIG